MELTCWRLPHYEEKSEQSGPEEPERWEKLQVCMSDCCSTLPPSLQSELGETVFSGTTWKRVGKEQRLFTVLLIFIQRLLRTGAMVDLLIALKQQLVLSFTFSQISHVLTFIFASKAKLCPVTNPNIVIKNQAQASIKIILMHWQRSKSCQKSKCSPTIKACVKW